MEQDTYQVFIDIEKRLAALQTKQEDQNCHIEKIESKLDRLVSLLSDSKDIHNALDGRITRLEASSKYLQEEVDQNKKFRLDIWKAILISLGSGAASQFITSLLGK